MGRSADNNEKLCQSRHQGFLDMLAFDRKAKMLWLRIHFGRIVGKHLSSNAILTSFFERTYSRTENFMISSLAKKQDCNF